MVSRTCRCNRSTYHLIFPVSLIFCYYIYYLMLHITTIAYSSYFIKPFYGSCQGLRNFTFQCFFRTNKVSKQR